MKTVFLVCTGLGRVNRGYESFTRECFDALKETTEFELFLIKGGGPTTLKEKTVFNFHRQSKTAFRIGRLVGRSPSWIEQFSFFFFFLPLLLRKKPALIYYSDFVLGTYLWHLRKYLKFKYVLLFSNGAPNGPPFKTEDHVQQLLPLYIQQAEADNTPLEKQTLLPYAINMDIGESIKRIKAKYDLRAALQLPVKKKVIISVGAVNKYHKRMDYVVNEFSKLDPNIYFLLILGQNDEESKFVYALAEEKLSKGSFQIKQARSEEVRFYMATSDYFILASLNEGLPRVLPEALSNGLLPIVHDYAVTRQTLNEYGIFKDLTVENSLSQALAEVDSRQVTGEEIVNYAWHKYSWDKLKFEYVQMIKKLLG